MKLKKHEALNYRCDKCRRCCTHINMHNDFVCIWCHHEVE